MTLTDRLDAERRRLMALPPVRSAVEATLAALQAEGAADAALRVGEVFPDFPLPEAGGRLVARDDLLVRGPGVISFFRGTWCPYCVATMDALEAALPAIAAAGGWLAAAMPETGGRAAAARRDRCLGYPVLVDVDNALAVACGVAFRVPEPYRAMLLGYGLDLAARQGSAEWVLPIPASFVLDAGGRVRRTFVEMDFTRRPEPAAVVAALREAGVAAGGAGVS